MTGHVFVSHGSDDSADANALAALVESKGAKAWIAPRDVRPGQDYSEQLQAAIEGCSAFVVLVSDKANKSPFVRAETEMAFSTSKPIFPVRMSDIQPAAGLAFFLKIRHWTDAFGPEREDNMARLVRELQAYADVPADPAPASPPAPIEPPAPPPPAAAAAAPAFLAAIPPTPPTAAADAAPDAPSAAPAHRPLPADTSLIEAAIGPNHAYYVSHWRGMDARGKSYDWNWPACLVNVPWFAYRKMWWPAILLGVDWLVATLLMLDPANKPAVKVGLAVLVLPSFLTGAFANRWYRNQTERLVSEADAMDRQQAIAHVTARGGTSTAGLLVSIALVLALSLAASLAAAINGAVRLQQDLLNQAGVAGIKPPPNQIYRAPDTPPAN